MTKCLAVVLLAGAIALPVPGCSSQPPGSGEPVASPIVGRWRSVSFQGTNIRGEVRYLELEFRSDHSFTSTTISKATRVGRREQDDGFYALDGDVVLVSPVPGLEPQPLWRFTMKGRDELIMENLKVDSTVRFRRVTDAPPAPGKSARKG